jgi:hypothetical protein
VADEVLYRLTTNISDERDFAEKEPPFFSSPTPIWYKSIHYVAGPRIPEVPIS